MIKNDINNFKLKFKKTRYKRGRVFQLKNICKRCFSSLVKENLKRKKSNLQSFRARCAEDLAVARVAKSPQKFKWPKSYRDRNTRIYKIKYEICNEIKANNNSYST